jgi:hypothetical protein
MHIKLYLFIAFALFFFCNCGGLKTIAKVEKSYPAASRVDPFRLFDLNGEYAYKPDEVVGEIKVKDMGLALDCDYDKVIQLLTEKAKIMGANALQITEHKLPDSWSSCHRITAKALRIKNAWQHEATITWYPERRLQIRDFKGDTVHRNNRDTLAVTASGFNMHWSTRLIDKYGRIKIDVIFDCKQSFFTHTPDSVSVLEHEQIHFDISELYARRFLQKAEIEFSNYFDFQKNYLKLWESTHFDCQIRQMEYDKEVAHSFSDQKRWIEGIAKELKELKKYETKELKLPNFKKKSK